MNKYVSRGLWFTLFLGGLSLAGVGVANAAETSGADGTASGEQAVVDLTAPVTLGGNGISVLGDSSSSGADTASVPAAAPASAPAVTTSGLDGVLSGSQAVAGVSVPVTLSGNAVSALGDSSSSDATTAAAPAPSGQASAPTTSGSDGIASGTQAPVDAAVPVTVGGNAISVLGDSESSGSTSSAPVSASRPSTSGSTTSGSDGLASGTQAPISAAVPVVAGGNAISLVGDSSAAGSSTSAGSTTDGDAGAPGGGTPTVPVALATGTMTAASGAATILGADAATTLAQTGSDDLSVGAIAALLALIGVVLMFGTRNRTAAKRLRRTHHLK
ncbi:hypothetical protein [Leifsonia sp. NPDC058230]|uniref:hypothetical protein n=1 Tax=Leifsonia sp. NPDC058230 TaxID=3346391 RepID=UPI0036DC14D4